MFIISSAITSATSSEKIVKMKTIKKQLVEKEQHVVTLPIVRIPKPFGKWIAGNFEIRNLNN